MILSSKSDNSIVSNESLGCRWRSVFGSPQAEDKISFGEVRTERRVTELKSLMIAI